MDDSPVLVTGGAGFLGSHVARLLLERGREVIVFDDLSNGKALHLDPLARHPGFRFVRGDVTDRKAIEEAARVCRVVMHFAVLDLRQSIKDPERVTEVNVLGTLRCLEAARRAGAGLFVNCSSSEAYGTARFVPMSEEHPLHPETPYAASKAAQDLLVESAGRTYGLPWVTVRPFNMYGPNSHWQGVRGELIPKMIVRALNGRPLVVFGDGLQTRDFTFVEDAARSILAVAGCAAARGETVNVCTGRETAIRGIAEAICGLTGADPATMIESQPARPADVRRHLGDPGKLRRLTGEVPSTILADGLARTLAWFRSLPFSAADLLAGEVVRNWE